MPTLMAYKKDTLEKEAHRICKPDFSGRSQFHNRERIDQSKPFLNLITLKMPAIYLFLSHPQPINTSHFLHLSKDNVHDHPPKLKFHPLCFAKNTNKKKIIITRVTQMAIFLFSSPWTIANSKI